MPSPPTLDPRYRLLDAWRGLACLMIVLYHAGFVLFGDGVHPKNWSATLERAVGIFYQRLHLGVPLFFVISGYCIAASMDAHRTRGASPWRFLGRRCWRIYPPYWAAMLCFMTVVATLDWFEWKPIRTGTHSLYLFHPRELSPAQWLGNLSLTETWRHKAFGGAPYLNLTRISWTLCFEEQFYLVGFALLLIWPRRLFVAIAVVSALILALDLAAFDAGWFNRLEGIFPELWYQFAAGLAVYWRLVRARSSQTRHVVDLALVALAATGWLAGNKAMAVVALFGLGLIALRPFDDRLTRARVLAPFRAAGRRCYSIYLIHLPVCTVGTEVAVQLGYTGFWTKALVVAPLVAVAGVGAGWLFYAGVERWFHNPPTVRLNRATAVGPVASFDPGESGDPREPNPAPLQPDLVG